MEAYDQETEQIMKRFYDTLSEKDRRRYAGIEALKYGPGGRSYIARVLGCSRRTVSRGATEVSQLSRAEVDRRIRRPGAGRKPYEEQWADIDDKFLQVLHDHTAGDPMDEKVRKFSVKSLNKKAYGSSSSELDFIHFLQFEAQ